MSIAIAAVIGLLVGGMLVWFFYARPLETQLKTAVSANHNLQQKVAETTEQLKIKNASITALSDEYARDQGLFAAAEIKISQLQNQLKRESYHADGLEEENSNLRHNLETAVSRSKQMQESLQAVGRQATTLKNENQQINQQLIGNRIEYERLQQQKKEEAKTAVSSPSSISPAHDLQYHLQTNQSQLETLKAQANSIRHRLMETDALRQQLEKTESELQATQHELNSLHNILSSQAAQLYSEREQSGEVDPLREIKGIGPVYALRLYEAGINTFAELAALTPEELEEKFGVLEIADPESWIAQAKARSE